MGALSDSQTAAFLNQHFVSAFQQVGDFEVVKVNGRVTKNGGNVASYFLTPQGHVIHAVPGPVNGSKLLREAEWAVGLYGAAVAQRAYPRGRVEYVARAHAAKAGRETDARTRRVHRLLSEYPMPPLKAVYDDIFEDILNEHVSKAGPAIARARQRLRNAYQRRMPVLFVFYDDDHDLDQLPWRTSRYGRILSTPALGALLRHWIVVPVRLESAPAFSTSLGLPLYEFPERRGGLVFVLADNDGRQLAAVSAGEPPDQLALALAEGLVDVAGEHGVSERRETAIRNALNHLAARDAPRIHVRAEQVRSQL